MLFFQGHSKTLGQHKKNDDPLVPNNHRPTPLGEGQVEVLLTDFLERLPQVVSFEQFSQGPTTFGRQTRVSITWPAIRDTITAEFNGRGTLAVPGISPYLFN